MCPKCPKIMLDFLILHLWFPYFHTAWKEIIRAGSQIYPIPSQKFPHIPIKSPKILPLSYMRSSLHWPIYMLILVLLRSSKNNWSTKEQTIWSEGECETSHRQVWTRITGAVGSSSISCNTVLDLTLHVPSEMCNTLYLNDFTSVNCWRWGDITLSFNVDINTFISLRFLDGSKVVMAQR